MADSLINRFNTKWEETESGCWNWTGWCYGTGYGRFSHSADKKESAHRLSYRLYKGDPAGFDVCHTCDNKQCVNPSHLFLGNAFTNANDMVAKGRSKAGRGKLPYGVGRQPGGRFAARIQFGGRMIHLGAFSTAEEAHAMAISYRNEMRGI